MPLIDPHKGIEDQLSGVDTHMLETQGDHPAAFIQLHLAAAQVNATCALVHAVRELIGEVQKLQANEGGD